MKTNLTIFSKNNKKAAVLAAVLGLAVTFTACKHNETQQPEAVAALAVTNAAPASVDFVLDNERVNTTAFEFGQKINYLRVYAGVRKGEVRLAGSNATGYIKDMDLVAGTYNSLYVVSQLDASTQKDTLSFILLTDTITADNGKSKVRFVNLSSDSPALKMEIDKDTVTFDNIAFKAATSFKNVTPNTYTITLKNQATGAAVATLADVSLSGDKFYTVWAKGLLNTTVPENKLAIKVDTH